MNNIRKSLKANDDVVLVYVITLIVIIISAIASPRFLDARNIGNLVEQGVVLGTIALAQMLVLLVGGIDLSVGALASCTVCILSTTFVEGPMNMVIGIAISLVMAVIVGAVNGLGIVKLGLPPFIMTLATMNVLDGIALKVRPTPGGVIPYDFMQLFNTRIGGVIPYSTVIWVVLLIGLWWMLRYRKFGRSIYAVGGNIVTSDLSGISSKKVIFGTYILSSVIVVIGAICLAARVGTGDPAVGSAYSMDSITVCALAGISLFGGRGNIWSMIGATFILMSLSNILNLVGIPTYYQYILKGAILLMAVLIMSIKDRRRA